jgi:hypothetical protein
MMRTFDPHMTINDYRVLVTELEAHAQEANAKLKALREAAQITYDWLLSDSIFMDAGQIEYHRSVLKLALPKPLESNNE